MRVVPSAALLFAFIGAQPHAIEKRASLTSAVRQAAPPCATAADCRRITLEAIERQDFETAHTLAWRAMQTGVKNDPESMRLLARAQSLSGRAHDALVMLQRLSQLGVRVEEAATSDDYRHMRTLSGWPAVLAAIEGTPLPPPAAVSTPTLPTALPVSPADLPAPEGGLPVPSSLNAIVALAYDAVSRRFIVADDNSDTVKIVDESSGRAMNLVSSGWADGRPVTALAIDTRRGDLWVATEVALHRVQLVSGRPLQKIAAPSTSPVVKFVAIGVGPRAVYALDAAGAKIYRLSAGENTLRLHAELQDARDAAGLAVASDGTLYVSHPGGIVRLPPGARRSLAVEGGEGVDLSALTSLSWVDGLLIATRREHDALTAVQLRLDQRGARVRAITSLGPVRSAATTGAGGLFYHVAAHAEGLAIVGRRPSR